mmetsp:Transcript_24474/g.35789  ORF Transcript_24474/g.35789 Transcript_24474/m.35789 type:complete len:122 (+) Transcript_24474:103-468(+)
MSEKLNELQNATVGMTAGVIEVLILQPLNYAKNMVQQGLPVSTNPMTMYRGVGANCVNMGSCTMIQFAVGGTLKQFVLKNDKTKKAFCCGRNGLWNRCGSHLGSCRESLRTHDDPAAEKRR